MEPEHVTSTSFFVLLTVWFVAALDIDNSMPF